MKLRWPRGRWNGQRIAGAQIKMALNVLDWQRPFVYARFGTCAIGCGPVMVWIERTYEVTR